MYYHCNMTQLCTWILNQVNCLWFYSITTESMGMNYSSWHRVITVSANKQHAFWRGVMMTTTFPLPSPPLPFPHTPSHTNTFVFLFHPPPISLLSVSNWRPFLTGEGKRGPPQVKYSWSWESVDWSGGPVSYQNGLYTASGQRPPGGGERKDKIGMLVTLLQGRSFFLKCTYLMGQ